MIVHPTMHLEIARQRHQDALARAERRRIAKARDERTAEAMADEAIGASRRRLSAISRGATNWRSAN